MNHTNAIGGLLFEGEVGYLSFVVWYKLPPVYMNARPGANYCSPHRVYAIFPLSVKPHIPNQQNHKSQGETNLSQSLPYPHSPHVQRVARF